MTSPTATSPTLQALEPSQGYPFAEPAKRINDGDHVAFFLASRAYSDIMTFIFQLNTAMLPRKALGAAREWRLDDAVVSRSPAIQNIAVLLDTLASFMDEAPPDPGPRRFGNASFGRWYDLVRQRVSRLMHDHLPQQVLAFKSTSGVSAGTELEAYLVGSFGSSQRLDYGTGHELSFLAFLACLWKLGAFPESKDGEQERGIVLGLVEPYLALVRRLILVYTLEPAGSHGVWGLDDHFFLPYIFGSAQFAPPITTSTDVAAEGSLKEAPNPADVVQAKSVERERKRNMYFSAIGFIYDVKKGPFWEHSPILYDISGVTAGWAKINKVCLALRHWRHITIANSVLTSFQGMIKMYNAEVLSKFPVIQHFPFGSLLAWEKDPAAKMIAASVHTSSQPKSSNPASTATTTSRFPLSRQNPRADTTSTRVYTKEGPPTTTAPWMTAQRKPPLSKDSHQATRAPWVVETSRHPEPAMASGESEVLPSANNSAVSWSSSRDRADFAKPNSATATAKKAPPPA